MPRRRGRWLCVGLLGAAACGEPATAPEVKVEAPAPAGTWSHAIVFEGGVGFSAIETPDEVEPGASLELSWRVEGPTEGLVARVGAWPPRAGSRQVALGGLGAPPVEVPVDARASFVEQPLTAQMQVSLPLSTPWHTPQVLVTVELLDGDDRVPATGGPRRHDGVAQLALVDVAKRPTQVVAVSMASPPVLDGRLDEPGWSEATAYPMFHSLDGEPYLERPGTVRWAWDAQALYVGADIRDPDVWSEYQRRDDPLWNQEVFEVFVFGDDRRRDYLELQVSPRGTVFDSRFEHYRKGEPAWNGQWQAAVDLRGTLDDRRDRDEGWSAELSIPWTEICAHTEVSCPVQPGVQLRINAFRFERPHKGPTLGLALSPPRVPDFHAPENAAVLKLGNP
ncbi:MAG: carbohydrate-binding family 9-like protein [Myxococcota bacterium]